MNFTWRILPVEPVGHCLKKQGHRIGRHKTRSLMRVMRLKTLYCKPRTTISDPAKYKYPYLLRGLKIKQPNQVCTQFIDFYNAKREHSELDYDPPIQRYKPAA